LFCKLPLVLYIEVIAVVLRGFLASRVRAVGNGRFSLTQPSAAARSTMQPNLQERRMMRRFDMRLPAIVRLGGTKKEETKKEETKKEGTNQEETNKVHANEFHTETQNVSARGVFFYLDRAVEAGTKLEVTLTFPPHVTLTDAVRVRFTARVIRIENPLPSFRIGTAAMIEDYEFLRSNDSPDFLTALEGEWKAAH
jgi:hypothetical protein